MKYTTQYVEKTLKRLNAVRDLHKPMSFANLKVCRHCWTIAEQNVTVSTNGFHHQYLYPCPTIQALEQA